MYYYIADISLRVIEGAELKSATSTRMGINSDVEKAR